MPLDIALSVPIDARCRVPLGELHCWQCKRVEIVGKIFTFGYCLSR